MPAFKKIKPMVIGALAVAAALSMAAPANAGPAEDACSAAGIPLCGLLPGVGDLDRAIDNGTNGVNAAMNNGADGGEPGPMPNPLPNLDQLNQLAQLAQLGGAFGGQP